MKKWNDYLSRTEQERFVLARVIWCLWFTWLCLVWGIGWLYPPVMIGDSAFANGTGIASSAAILATLRPSIRSQRLHVSMFFLCFLIYFAIQSKPHIRFINNLSRIEKGLASL